MARSSSNSDCTRRRRRSSPASSGGLGLRPSSGQGLATTVDPCWHRLRQHLDDLRSRRTRLHRRLERHLPLHRHHRRPDTPDGVRDRRLALCRRLRPRERGTRRSAAPPTVPASGPCRSVLMAIGSSARPRSRATTRVAVRATTSRRRRAFPVTTSNIGDGTWTARVGAVDAGGNFTAAGAQTITVDNNAPAAPTATSPSSLTTADATTRISWTEPSGQVSPITTAHITLCKAGGACSTTTQPAGAGAGAATLSLADGPGNYAASVALTDAAGNFDPNRAAHWAITRATPSGTTTPGSPERRNEPPQTSRTSPRLTAATPTVARDRRTDHRPRDGRGDDRGSRHRVRASAHRSAGRARSPEAPRSAAAATACA